MNNIKFKNVLPGAVVIVCAVLVFYWVINSFLDYLYLKKDYAYTISNKISIGMSMRTGTNNKYTFCVNGKNYAGYTTLSLHRDGMQYFIRYYPKNPNRNEVTTVIANPEDIRNLPSDGYKELPHN